MNLENSGCDGLRSNMQFLNATKFLIFLEQSVQLDELARSTSFLHFLVLAVSHCRFCGECKCHVHSNGHEARAEYESGEEGYF